MHESIPSDGCMWRGEVSIIIESRNIDDLQRIYRRIIPLLKRLEIQLSEQVVKLEHSLFVFGI